MGCCSSTELVWDNNFTTTDLSSNRCDAEWEDVTGSQATFGMAPHFYPCARFGIVRGVIRVKVGFAGGLTEHPTYPSPGDHTLAVNVEYNPELVTYEQLIDIFWSHHDLFLESDSKETQSTIFCHDQEEMDIAKECLAKEQEKHTATITTMIRPFTTFVPSEDNCQHFLLQWNKEIMKLLGNHLLPSQMAHSHLACKIEGFLVGFGMPGQFYREVPELYLPDKVVEKVARVCDRNQPAENDVENAKDWDKVHQNDASKKK